MRGGMIVMDWEQIVRHLSVSSNESQVNRLTDGVHSTYWQSSGPQGKVSGSGCSHMKVNKMKLDRLKLATNKTHNNSL